MRKYTTLKYISNFKKIVIRAIDREIIIKDPFRNFKGKKTKIVKKPYICKRIGATGSTSIFN